MRSELGDAALVANALGTKHHELELSMRDSAVELEDLVWALDEPLADLSALGFLALSELAARHVTVAIAGQGADELFGGYPRHWRAGLVERAQVVPRPLARFGAARLGSGRYGRFANAIAATDPAHRYLSLRTPFFDPETRARIVRDPLCPDDSRAREVVGSYGKDVRGGARAETMYLDSRLGLVDDMLHYFDRVSMAHSLEVRVPFLDHEVVELAATIPRRSEGARTDDQVPRQADRPRAGSGRDHRQAEDGFLQCCGELVAPVSTQRSRFRLSALRSRGVP